MKLGNLASFDPILQLRGIRGLQGASNLDREIGDEYHANSAELIPLAQEKSDAPSTEGEDETTEVIPGTGILRVKRPPEGDTTGTALVKTRKGQDYFRDVVLNNYNGRCGVTGLPVRALLIASHILPWSNHEANLLNVRNGISLNRLHDAAFDKHLISFDDSLGLILSVKLKSLLPDDTVYQYFEAYEGKSLILPEDGILPEPYFLATHRERLALK